MPDLSRPVTDPRPRLALLLPEPRRSVWAGVVAVLLHAALVALLVWVQWRGLMAWQAAAAGRAGETAARAGGGGGGSIQAVALPAYRAPASATAVRPPAPVEAPPVEAPPVVAPPAEPAPPVATVTTDSVTSGSPGQGGTGSGGGSGSGSGTGTGSGTGPGSGAGSGGGAGSTGRAVPPEPRQLILPPLDYPRDMRGRSVSVTFWVNVDGRVERVELAQSLDDRGFQKKFIEVMRNYRFRPARGPDGQVVPGVTTVTVTF